jgi:hypothetical protein
MQPLLNIQNDAEKIEPDQSFSIQLQIGSGAIREKVIKSTNNQYLNLMEAPKVSKCDALEVSYKTIFFWLRFYVLGVLLFNPSSVHHFSHKQHFFPISLFKQTSHTKIFKIHSLSIKRFFRMEIKNLMQS